MEQKGEKILENDGDWLKVQYTDSKEGYVSAEYVTISEEFIYAKTIEEEQAGNCRTEGIAGKRTDCRAGCPGGDHEHHTSRNYLYLQCGTQTGYH